jgi:hypothetical protein
MPPLIRSIVGVGLCVVLALFLALSAQAQVRGVSYTFAPEAGRLYFDRNAGLADDYFYGGMLGFGFGEFVELSARYTFAPTIRRDLTNIGGVTDAVRTRLGELPDREIILRTYGGALRFNLGTGGLVPYAKVGAGILDVNGDDLNRSRLIYAAGGGGIQISANDRYAIFVGAENLTYRQNLGATLFTADDLDESGLVAQNFRPNLVHNWSVSVGLKAYLGGIAPGSETDIDQALRAQLEGGIRGLRLIVEPFYGVINFNEELTFAASQTVGGVFAGIDMGPYVGLRAFYWRGMDGDAIAFEDLQAYGGELRLAFGAGGSVSPHVILGGGYLDPLEGYEGREGVRPNGEPFVTGGAGVTVPLSDNIELIGGFRLLLTSSEAVDNTSQPSDIFVSPMFNGGIRFAVGGRRPSPGVLVQDRDDTLPADPMQAEIRRLRARIDSLERARVTSDVRVADAPTAVIDEEGRVVVEQAGRRGYRSDQMVTIPVPEEGEIYIRYGPPAGTVMEALPGGQVALVDTSRAAARVGGLSTADIQQIVRETIRAELAAVDVGATDVGAMARLEQRINEQLDRMQIRMEQQLRTRQPIEPVTIAVDSRVASRTVRGDRGVAAFSPFTGFTLGQAKSMNVGVRADYRGDFLPFLSWFPELTFGFGTGGVSYNLNMTGAYRLDFIPQAALYIGVGVGMLGFNESPEDVPGVQFLLNAVIGSEFNVGTMRLFGEYMAMDFGDFHRFSFGLRYSF